MQNNEVLPLSERVYEDFDARLLVLHRGRVFEELIQQVNDFEVSSKTTVQVEMFTLNGSQEGAIDDGGVLRDALTEFFERFYESCTNGTSYKVSIIREDFNA